MKSTVMRKPLLFSAVLSLFLLVPASITRAQTITSQKGLTTAVFPTQYGNVKVLLPDDVRPGDMISGTVVAEPKGNNARQLEKNLAELIKYTVNLDGNKYALGAKPETFKWLVHQDRQVTAPLELLNVTGVKAHELKMQIGSAENNTPASSGCAIPSHALTDAPCKITGNFDGDASNTKCTLNNQPMQVLAESPRQCQVQYPQNANGIQTIQVSENGQEKCTRQISGVNMQVTSGDLNLRKGQNTYIDVKLTGLQNLPDTALLTITNVTPNIVTMTNGNVQVFAIMFTDSEGVWEIICPAVSIATGNFSVNINLDLPGNLYDDHPPTQPQPGDNPQPKDTTTQPPTTTEQPTCKCHGDCSILFGERKRKNVSYWAKVDAECIGKDCSVYDIKYRWSVTPADVAEIDGINYAPGVTIKLKKPGPYTVHLNGKVICTNGSECDFACSLEQMNPPPTTTEQPKCKCHGDCSILFGERKGKNISYWAKVNAECIGKDCSVYDIKYKWSVTPADVAEIDGINYAPGVTLLLKKPGPYNVHLNGKVICTDGSECEFGCSLEQMYNPPTTTEDVCTKVIEEITEPAMKGRLKINTNFPAKRKILRDDGIALGAEGADYDMLKIICKSTSPECTESEINVALAGRVGFKWTINNGKGRFVKLGCLFTNNGNDQQDEGEHVIFMPPYVPLPAAGVKETTETTKITLTIIDEKKDGMNDGQIPRDFEIKTTRNSTDSNLYTVEIVYTYKDKLPVPPKELPPKGSCEAKHGPWVKEPDKLTKPIISLPKVTDNDKMVLGQWIVLEANDQHEKDMLKDIVCKPSAKCTSEPAVDKSYEDNVQWEWQRIGDGRLVSGPLGRYVIYEAPAIMPEGKQELEVKFKVKVFNPEKNQATDDEMWSDEITIKIYQPGIQIQYPPENWLPAESKSAVPLSSELKYLKDGKWEPALAHMCRIHFFELLNVSEEKGICMNYPEKEKANQCRDLQFNNEAGHEVYDAGKIDKAKCTFTDQWLKARTEKPEKEYTVNVHSLDYGSYGFILSKAQLSKNTVGDFTTALQYVSIPWTNETVKHLHKVKRDKAKKYDDNRVTIPYDIDENHIADNGWPNASNPKDQLPDPIRNNADDDADPPGASPGDGLTNYEEYRGFMIKPKKVTVITGAETVEIEEKVHVRTNPGIKSIFIHNKNNLPIKLYTEISKLEVFEITEPQYQSYKIRVVNFNSNRLTHIVDQKGLYLYDGGYNKDLFGKAYSQTGKPARPNEEDSIVIYPDRIKEHVNKINSLVDEYNKDPEKVKKAGGKFQYLDIDDKKAATVAHELLHANNVCHHGEGKEDVEKSHDLVNGLRSGDISCVMRYDNTGNSIFLDFFPEKPGKTLCSNPVGTFYNAPPVKKNEAGDQIGWGNCAPGRGNCASQIWISGAGQIPVPCPKPK